MVSKCPRSERCGTSDDRTLSFSHNPAGQIISRTDSNTGYAWTGFVNFDEATSYNGLNRMLSVTGQSTAPQYDGRGNMTRDHQGQTYEYARGCRRMRRCAGSFALLLSSGSGGGV